MFLRQQGARGEQMEYAQEKLLEKRVVFLLGTITAPEEGRFDMASAPVVMDTLWVLSQVSNAPIRLVVDSNGGNIEAGLHLCDMIQLVKAPVYTIGRSCKSMGAFILAHGEPGYRYLFPHAGVMLHNPAFGGKMSPADAEELLKIKERMVDALITAGVTKTREEVSRDIDTDHYLTAPEAVAYGLADKLVTPEVLDVGKIELETLEREGA